MAFILPGIGNMMGGMLGSATSALLGSSNTILHGVGKVLSAAGKFASTAGNVYKTVTDGVMSFVKNVGGSVVNKVGSLLGTTKPLVTSAPTTVSDGFQKWMRGVADDIHNIPSPYRPVAQEVTKEVVENPYEKSMQIAFDQDYAAPSMADSIKKTLYDTGIDNRVVKDIVDAEQLGDKSLFDQVTSYAAKAVGKIADTTINTFSDTVGQGLAVKAGLAPENKTQVTQINNVIPKFDSKPLNDLYEASGINYGGLPSNRVQYFAANNPQYGDFGKTGFGSFSVLRGQ